MRLLGVNYLHLPTPEGGDLYITRFGVHYLDQLRIENWHEREWYQGHRERLLGTSTVYKVRTKEVAGQSLDLVVKYCRVGEEVPIDTRTMDRFAHVEFNSPYEEFALLMELREQHHPTVLRTHHPLAIYVPPERLELWQTGRSHHRIARKKAKFQDVELDVFRQYILIYEWIDGESADVVYSRIFPDPAECEAELRKLTAKVLNDMEQRGFLVVDHKPAHIILRTRPGGGLLRHRSGELPYALVDFELLIRTPEREQQTRNARRAQYLQHQRDRFAPAEPIPLPPHLRQSRLFDVDYITGSAESTHGMLWVVGRDPELFDYFLPERWRHTPRKRLSDTNETYYTLTKDRINLVWKLSRVGEQPETDTGNPATADIVAHGYNSPFEEFSIALELSRRGISTTYARAIYRSGLESTRSGLYVTDQSRFLSHRELTGMDDKPLMPSAHVYITIWGYWNGLDEMLAQKDEAYCQGIDLGAAWRRGLVSQEDMLQLIKRKLDRMRDVGFESLAPKPSHFLLSLRQGRHLLTDERGDPVMRVCNFELIRRIPPKPRAGDPASRAR